VVPLDDAIDEEVAFLKVDVEGAEMEVLRGCERLLSERLIEQMYFEHNEVRARQLGYDDQGPVAYLRQFGYQVEQLGDDYLAHRSA
jgi:hypothetical protein